MEYQYDQLGRLLSAATQGAGGWGLAWNHDGFGNLTQQSVTKGSLTGFTHSVNGTTNRINGQNYDANGNWTGSYGQMQTYDIENRIQTAYGPQYSELYLYSGRNERIVSKRGQDRHRVHFYGADGLLLGIYTLEITQQNPSNTYPVRIAAQERLYFGGRLMQIGGEWVATDRLGSVVRKSTTNYKYAPYGQEIGGATANDTNKFATYTRDSLSGLDYALNRYYKPEWGRFTSPDPYQASGGPADPGSWNRYTYVGGDPINYNDSLGLQSDPVFSITVTAAAPRQIVRTLQGPLPLSGDLEFLLLGYPNDRIKGPVLVPDMSAYEEGESPILAEPACPPGQERMEDGTCDVPLTDDQARVLRRAGKRAAHDLGCVGLGFAVGDVGVAGITAGWPTIDKPFSQGGAPRTSAASEAFREWTGGARGRLSLPAFEGGLFTGIRFKYVATTSVGGFWGRWLPPAGFGFTALGFYQMLKCLSTTP